MNPAKDQSSQRADICRKHGLASEAEAYTLILKAAKTGVQALQTKRLTARELILLGYTLEAMRKLKFTEDSLAQLGYPVASRKDDDDEETPHERVKEMLARGLRAEQLRVEGVTIHHLKRAGAAIQELQRLGFHLDDYIQAYSATELRRAGFGIRELKRYFNGRDLKTAGFDATDMRNAGFTIRELLNFGYNENQVKIAGYSVNELAREGLTRHTVDKSRLH